MRVDENYWLMQARFWLNRRWRAKRRKDAETLLRFRKLVRSLPAGALAVDCGANVGTVTDLLLKAGLRVIAFEPDPDAFRELSAKFGNHPRAILHNKAVGASARTMKLHRTPKARTGDIGQTIGSTLISHALVDADEGIVVEVIDLPKYLLEIGEEVSLLKLDVEGAEAEIVQALLDRGHDHIRTILVETHEGFIPEIAEDLARIRKRVAEERLSKFDLEWV